MVPNKKRWFWLKHDTIGVMEKKKKVDKLEFAGYLKGPLKINSN